MADSCQPDGWFKIGNPTLVPAPGTALGGGTQNQVLFGEFNPNEGFGQYLGLLTAGGAGGLVNEDMLVGLVAGRKVCAGIDAALDSTSVGDEMTLVLGYHDGTDAFEVETKIFPPAATLRRFVHYQDVGTTAKQVYFKVVNKTASVVEAYFDNAMLHVGEFPLQYRPSTGWREERWDFGIAGNVTVAAMAAGIVPGGRYRVSPGSGGYVMGKATAHAEAAPMGGDDVFLVVTDGTDADGIQLTLEDGEDWAEAHITDYTVTPGHEFNATLGGRCSAQGGATSASTGVVLSTWGYYYVP